MHGDLISQFPVIIYQFDGHIELSPIGLSQEALKKINQWAKFYTIDLSSSRQFQWSNAISQPVR
jgi:hypothetical protein